MQLEKPEDYEAMDEGKPFRAAVGNLTEQEVREAAAKDCKRCLGTGREGFIEGVAIVCRCVKKKLLQNAKDGPHER